MALLLADGRIWGVGQRFAECPMAVWPVSIRSNVAAGFGQQRKPHPLAEFIE